jgi:hypothetical protein
MLWFVGWHELTFPGAAVAGPKGDESDISPSSVEPREALPRSARADRSGCDQAILSILMM